MSNATRTCASPGCNDAYYSRDLCRVHYNWAYRHGLLDITHTLPASERLKSKLVARPNGCLEWTGAKANGYGRFMVNGKYVKTHRLAWELANEREVPPDMMVCHHCDNPPCCNPEHLFLGTNADNLGDMAAKGRASRYNAEKSQCPQGHPYDESNTVVTTHKDGTTQRTCRTCERARYARQYLNAHPFPRPPRTPKTHCIRGHLYDEANTLVSQGKRYCRACNKIASAAYYQRKLAMIRRAVEAVDKMNDRITDA